MANHLVDFSGIVLFDCSRKVKSSPMSGLGSFDRFSSDRMYYDLFGIYNISQGDYNTLVAIYYETKYRLVERLLFEL